MNYEQLPLVKDIRFLSGPQLSVIYDDGSMRIVDCAPSHPGSIYQRFLDDQYFKKARIDTQHNTIVRDEDLDMDGYGIFLSSLTSQAHGTN